MKTGYKYLIALLILTAVIYFLSDIKKAVGMSFINTQKGTFEIVYKGKVLADIKGKECAVVYFKGEFPKTTTFKCEIQVSNDFELIKYENSNLDFRQVWKSGIEVENSLTDMFTSLKANVNEFKKIISRVESPINDENLKIVSFSTNNFKSMLSYQVDNKTRTIIATYNDKSIAIPFDATEQEIEVSIKNLFSDSKEQK